MSDYRRDRHRKKREATEQEALISWCRVFENRYPELKLIYHVPNGGSRNQLEAANLKRQGVKAGVPDLCLPVPRMGYHGLYIEMKFGRNKTTQEQEKWLDALGREGYRTAVCYGADEAQQEIKDYLGIARPAETQEQENTKEVTAGSLIEILKEFDPETVVIGGNETNIRVYPGRENKPGGRGVIMLR